MQAKSLHIDPVQKQFVIVVVDPTVIFTLFPKQMLSVRKSEHFRLGMHIGFQAHPLVPLQMFCLTVS